MPNREGPAQAEPGPEPVEDPAPALSNALLDWTSAVAADGARVESVTGLRSGGPPWLLRFAARGAHRAAVLRLADPEDGTARAGLRVEALALEYAARHAIPAPRLLGMDPDGAAAGEPALLISALDGTSRIPRAPVPGRLRALGAACAVIHAAPAPVDAGLPRRRRPIETVDFAGVRRARGTRGLVAEAEQLIGSLPEPEAAPVFVHGDLWQGNTMWTGGAFSAFIDWDCAGSGHWGVDLGSARCDAAVMYGAEYADEVLDGWLAARAGGAGRERPDPRVIAYWDAVACLSTPPDMAEFIEPIHGQGRTDLDQPTLAARRDALLRAALDALA